MSSLVLGSQFQVPCSNVEFWNFSKFNISYFNFNTQNSLLRVSYDV
jgi:hypothetical protein